MINFCKLFKFSKILVPFLFIILLTYREHISRTNSEYISWDSNVQKRFPTAIIIGSQKCGTSVLLHYLSFHPSIACNKYLETHFFDSLQNNSITGYNSYLRKVPFSKKGQITLEKSPNYFYRPEVPKLVHDYQKYLQVKLKFIIVVRQPLRRAVSHAFHSERHGKLKITNLTEVLLEPKNHYVRTSLYGKNLKSWLKFFSPDQFLILDGEKLARENPVKTLQPVDKFLNIPTYFTEFDFFINTNKGFYCYRYLLFCFPTKTGHKKYPQNVTENGIQFLNSVFAEDLNLFSQLSGYYFDWMQK